MNKQSPALLVDDVCVAYDKKEIVSNISFSVDHGETFGLIGLNGAGKTTIIKSILGLRDCDKGQVTIDGNSVFAKQTQSKIAFLPERFDPPWFLSGIEFIKFSLRLYNIPFDKERVYSLSEGLALNSSVLKNKVQTYSKGMRQKLGILANLLSECPLLILDEPMSGLDPKARLLVKDALERTKSEGKTIFVCSHILSDMDEICDRVAVLNNGRIVFQGDPAKLKENTKEPTLERAFIHIIEVKAA